MSSVGFDFDGVIHTYEKGWHDGTIYGEPIEGIFDLIKYTQTQHAVFVHTVRRPTQVAEWLCRKWTDIECVTEDGPPDTLTTWKLAENATQPAVIGQNEFHNKIKFWNDFEQIFITNRKLPALAYVDDRAVRFMNSHQALNELRHHGVLTYG